MLRMADSYHKLGKDDLASQWYKKAFTLDPHVDESYILKYISFLNTQGKQDELNHWISFYRDKINHSPGDGNQNLDKDSTVFILCDLASLNSAQSDAGPFLYNDKLIFSSDRAADGLGHYSLFSSVILAAGQLEKPIPFHSKINAGPNRSAITIASKTGTVFFTGKSQLPDGTNSMEVLYTNIPVSATDDVKINKLAFKKFDHSMGHPTVNSDGTLMIFAANSASHTRGFDLYRSEYNGKKWSTPVSLGTAINTHGDEMYPTLYNDSILYFASNGHNGLGGFDIYQVNLRHKTHHIEHLHAPLNSPGDDFGLVINSHGTEGYLTSTRPGGLGKEDLYKVYLLPARHHKHKRKVNSDGTHHEELSMYTSKGDEIKLVKNDKGNIKFDFTPGRKYNLVVEYDNYKTGTVKTTNNVTGLPKLNIYTFDIQKSSEGTHDKKNKSASIQNIHINPGDLVTFQLIPDLTHDAQADNGKIQFHQGETIISDRESIVFSYVAEGGPNIPEMEDSAPVPPDFNKLDTTSSVQPLLAKESQADPGKQNSREADKVVETSQARQKSIVSNESARLAHNAQTLNAAALKTPPMTEKSPMQTTVAAQKVTNVNNTPTQLSPAADHRSDSLIAKNAGSQSIPSKAGPANATKVVESTSTAQQNNLAEISSTPTPGSKPSDLAAQTNTVAKSSITKDFQQSPVANTIASQNSTVSTEEAVNKNAVEKTTNTAQQNKLAEISSTSTPGSRSSDFAAQTNTVEKSRATNDPGQSPATQAITQPNRSAERPGELTKAGVISENIAKKESPVASLPEASLIAANTKSEARSNEPVVAANSTAPDPLPSPPNSTNTIANQSPDSQSKLATAKPVNVNTEESTISNAQQNEFKSTSLAPADIKSSGIANQQNLAATKSVSKDALSSTSGNTETPKNQSIDTGKPEAGTPVNENATASMVSTSQPNTALPDSTPTAAKLVSQHPAENPVKTSTIPPGTFKADSDKRATDAIPTNPIVSRNNTAETSETTSSKSSAPGKNTDTEYNATTTSNILKTTQKSTAPEVSTKSVASNLSSVTTDNSTNNFQYRVQIAASRSALNQDNLKKIYDGNHDIRSFKEDGYFKYYIEETPSYPIAKRVLQESGVEEGFIVAYQGNTKVKLQEAIAHQKRQEALRTQSFTQHADSAVVTSAAAQKISTDEEKSSKSVTGLAQSQEERSAPDDLALTSHALRSDEEVAIKQKNASTDLSNKNTQRTLPQSDMSVQNQSSRVVQETAPVKQNETTNYGDSHQHLATHAVADNNFQYRLQIAATKSRLSSTRLKKIYGGPREIHVFEEEGLYKYYIQEGSNYYVVRQALRESNVEHAFISAYNKGEKLPLQDAIALQYKAPVINSELNKSDSLIKIVTVNFDLDEFTLLPEQMTRLRKSVIDELKDHPAYHAIVNGYTDIQGTEEYNIGLSQERAFFTEQLIVAEGIAADRIATQYFGESQVVKYCPHDEHCDESIHQVNRRVEILLLMRKKP